MPREPPSAARALSSQTLTYEIILTLGQAFEVAYQLALQAQRVRPVGASAAEPIETKSSKPVPKPRVGREEVSSTCPWPARGLPPSAAPRERARPLGSRRQSHLGCTAAGP